MAADVWCPVGNILLGDCAFWFGWHGLMIPWCHPHTPTSPSSFILQLLSPRHLIRLRCITLPNTLRYQILRPHPLPRIFPPLLRLLAPQLILLVTPLLEILELLQLLFFEGLAVLVREVDEHLVFGELGVGLGLGVEGLVGGVFGGGGIVGRRGGGHDWVAVGLRVIMFLLV